MEDGIGSWARAALLGNKILLLPIGLGLGGLLGAGWYAGSEKVDKTSQRYVPLTGMYETTSEKCIKSFESICSPAEAGAYGAMGAVGLGLALGLAVMVKQGSSS